MLNLLSKIRNLRSKYFLLSLSLLIFPSLASAHEMYVLSKAVTTRDIAAISPNPFSIVASNQHQFILWGLLSSATVVGIFILSITKSLERLLDPALFRIKKFAPLIARLTLGLCFIASAHYGGLFGPELPFSEFTQGYGTLLSLLLYVLGFSLLLGIAVRLSAIIALAIFSLGVFHYGVYMFTYLNYLGEILINLILGNGAFSLGRKFFGNIGVLDKLFATFEEYGFFLLRVFYGTAVIFASWYAKFYHSQLALDTISQYHLSNYFHFNPLFTVLGAFIVEALIGVFFVIGFEVRFTAIVFLIFLTLSLLYFGEAVWPHIILIGVNIAFLVHGYDRFTIEGYLFRKTKLEPIF